MVMFYLCRCNLHQKLRFLLPEFLPVAGSFCLLSEFVAPIIDQFHWCHFSVFITVVLVQYSWIWTWKSMTMTLIPSISFSILSDGFQTKAKEYKNMGCVCKPGDFHIMFDAETISISFTFTQQMLSQSTWVLFYRCLLRLPIIFSG